MQVDDLVVAIAPLLPGGVIARCLQVAQVLFTDVAGDVLAAKHGAVEAVDVRVTLRRAAHEVVEILVQNGEAVEFGQPLFLLRTDS